MATKQQRSKRVSERLDDIGFSKERIRERSHTMDKLSKAADIFTKKINERTDVSKIFVGSRREGLGLFFHDDTDILQIDHGVFCRKNHQHFSNIKQTVFIMEQNNVPPGYCLLKLSADNFELESYKRIMYALDERATGHYLSSEKFMSQNDDVFHTGTGYISKIIRYLPRQGPSIPYFLEDDMEAKHNLSQTDLKRMKKDFVRAFPCAAKELLIEWRERKRPSDWPTQETIDYVMQQPMHVVPVGQKGCSNEDLQWRICFNLAEIHLVKSFNIIQTKVFVLLKMIAKDILRPVSSSITSFIMKNVALWLAEETPQEQYREEKLLDRLEDALVYLRGCVDKAELPCYMIPKRNLFAEKLKCDEKRLLRKELDHLLQNGNICKEIDRMTEVYLEANAVDKNYTCSIAMLSTDELTERNVAVFLSHNSFEVAYYSTIFHGIPFLLTYGIKGVLNPLSIDLSSKITEELKSQSSMITQDETEGAFRQPKPHFTLEEIFGIVQIPIQFLFLSFVLDVVVYLNIPGLSSLWNSDIFKKCVQVILFLIFFVNEYRKVKQAYTLIERKGRRITALKYIPEKLLLYEDTVRSLNLLVIFDSFELFFNFPLQITLLTFISIVLGRLSRKVKELIPWQDMWLWVLTFKAPCLGAMRRLPRHRTNIPIPV